jgi:hypothetical protein
MIGVVRFTRGSGRTALGEVVKQSKLGLKDRHTTAHGNAMGMLVKDRDKP